MRVTVEYEVGIDRGFLLKTSTTLETRQGGVWGGEWREKERKKKKSQNKASKVKWHRLQVIVPGF